MAQFKNERNGDVVTVPKALEKKYDASPAWERVSDKKTAPKAEEKKA